MIQRMFLIAAISVCLAEAGRAHDIARAHITCGGTLFRATTKFIYVTPYAQTITAQWSDHLRSINLRERKMAFPWELGSRLGLGFIVATWQCRKTPIGFVLVLAYDCGQLQREDGPQPECNGPNDWERYVALDGTLLDDGYSFNDKRYAALRRRLGYHDAPNGDADDGTFQSALREGQ